MLANGMLAVDAFGFSPLMKQSANPLGLFSLMPINPALFFGRSGKVLSMCRQLEIDA